MQNGTNVLYVGKLRKEDTGKVLDDYFEEFGTLLSVKIKTDLIGNPKGFAFVTYVDTEASDRALSCGHPRWDIKPKSAMDKVYKLRVNPSDIYFTHHDISPCFQNGITVDDVIASIACKNMSFADLPAMQVRKHQGKYYSISNRRLFVALVLANMGLLSEVVVDILDPKGNRLNQMKDGLTKWERSFSTLNGGLSVQMGSKGPCRVCGTCHVSDFLDQQ